MLSLNSFSQTDTTKVTLPTKVVRLAAKDLVRYDGCKVELKLTQDKVIKLQEREAQKDTIINFLTVKDKNNQFIIGQKDVQIGEYKGMTESIEVVVITFDDLIEITESDNRIDFLKLDTEGMDLQIIQSIDFQKYDIRVILMEIRWHWKEHAKDYLEQNGYLVQILENDLFAVKLNLLED